MMDPTSLRLQLVDNGWHPIPVRGKVPVVENWQVYCRCVPTDDEIDHWRQRHTTAANTGIALGRQVVIDIDVASDAALARQIRVIAVECFGSTPFVRVGREPKVALVYRAAEPIRSRAFKAAARNGDGIDILSDGRQFVAFGLHPDTGQLYKWVGESSPLDAPPDDATPAITDRQVEEFLDRVHSWMPLGLSGDGAVGPRPAGNGAAAEIVRDPDTDLVVDGREEFLRACIWRAAGALSAGHEPLTAEAVAARGWAYFSDPVKGAYIEDRRWTERQALQKARATVRRLKNCQVKLRAVGPTVAPTYEDRTRSVEEARRATEDAIRFHLAKAAAYNATKPAERDEDAAPPVHAIRVGTGIGKTTVAARVIAEAVKAGVKRSFLYAVPTHRLGQEIVEQFRAHGVTARVFRGRSAPDPDRPGQAMCDDLGAVELALAIGAPVETSCCKEKKPADGVARECPFYNSCSYQRQKRERPDVWIVAHQLLFSPQSAVGKVEGVFIDEGFWQAGTWAAKRGLTIDEIEAGLPFDPARMDTLNDLDSFRRKLARALRRQSETGGFYREHLVAEGLTPDDCSTAISLEWRLKEAIPIRPGMSPDARRAAAQAAKGARHVRAYDRTWSAARSLLWAKDETVSGRLILTDEEGEHGVSRVVRSRGGKSIAKQWDAPTCIMDATLPSREILQAFYPSVEVLAEVDAAMPHVVVQQVVHAPVSASKLIRNRDGEGGRNLQSIRRAILHRFLGVGRAATLVIAQKEVALWLRESGLPNGIAVEWFNNVAGLDGHKDVRLLIGIGRTLPDVFAVESAAGSLTGSEAVKTAPSDKGLRWYDRVTRGIRLRDGSGYPVEGDQHPDPVAEAVRWQVCEGELIQAIGRARGVNRTAESPLDIEIWSDVVLPVTVDRVLTWDQVEDGHDAEMLLDGVVLESPTGMAKCWPGVWATAEAARRWQSRTTSGHNPIKDTLYRTLPACGRYQHHGERQKWRAMRYDPAVVLDPRAWLEARLGPLAGFEAAAGVGAEMLKAAG